jgi:large subunit ribosomal protein L30
MPRIKITQEKSSIRTLLKHRRTLEALGLRRINHSVVHEDTPQIRGMVDQVRYLVRVESETGVQTASPTKARRKKS